MIEYHRESTYVEIGFTDDHSLFPLSPAAATTSASYLLTFRGSGYSVPANTWLITLATPCLIFVCQNLYSEGLVGPSASLAPKESDRVFSFFFASGVNIDTNENTEHRGSLPSLPSNGWSNFPGRRGEAHSVRYSSLSACLAKLLRMSSLAIFDRLSRIPARILDYPRIARLSQNRSIIVDYAQIVNFRRFEGKCFI